ncbi:MAG: dTDP-4-dehydrorhamnose 3,5-epimerase [Chloroflexi bacterium]|nr:dTDP-4-dehydrorhamnose 3,5-epimerase [Chloroflexota bacterium]
MKVQSLAIPEVLLISRERYADARGWFTELHNGAALRDGGFSVRFLQDNLSWSLPGVIRGLHLQYGPAQGKLVTCLMGRIFDVAVDVRPSSPSYGQHVAAELSGENGDSLWIPPGFAHGFAVLGSDPALVLYKVDQPRSAEGERGVIWNDATLAIPWPIERPTLSERDAALPTLAELQPPPPGEG